MKNILVATDFSVPAENAAHYAIHLAKCLKANITLCNAYNVPSEAPMAAQVAWPLIDEEGMETESDGSLTQLVEKLSAKACTTEDTFCPQLTFESEKGEVHHVVREMVRRKNIDLVVMGMAGAGRIIQWALGSNSKAMIDLADFPVLYVPSTATFKKIERIAFTTDLSPDDLAPLQFLCILAEQLGAEIIVYHIAGAELKKMEKDNGIDEKFFEQVVCKLDYKRIKYEQISHSDIQEGLRWIRNNEDIDIIAMVHRQHTLVDKLLNGSHAHKLSRFTQVPLLIFQPSDKTHQ